MSALEVFQYGDHPVRTVTIDGEPWFVASDVSSILGYRMASDMTRRLDDDEKGTRSVRTPGGEQSVAVISEPGLYTSILASRVHLAKNFKRWVTHEVLPAIRRTGSYSVRIPGTYAEALEAAAAEARRADALEARVAEDAPKVAAYDALIDADGYYSMESVAKLGGIGRTTLFRRLREAGVIQQDNRLPYQRHMGWFKITTAPWGDPKSGPSGVSSTARVRPEALTKVLAKAGVTLEAVRS